MVSKVKKVHSSGKAAAGSGGAGQSSRSMGAGWLASRLCASGNLDIRMASSLDILSR